MKKMPTLFERQFENHEIIKCLNKVHDGCEWVLKGEGYATEKLDGTCCMIKDNQLYSSIQYDAFACIAEDENYYTISQGNQKVPKSWIDSKI